MPDQMTLDQAVDNAVENSENEEASELDAPEESEEEQEDTPEEGDEESEEEPSGDDLSEQQLAQAKNLYKLLSNPKTSVATISDMVKRAGYTLTEAKQADKEEKTEIAQDILNIFKEELGDDFDLVAGNGLVRALSKVLDSRIKPLQTRAEEVEFNARKKEVDTALDWAYTNLDGFKQTESLILEKMQAYPYNGKNSYKTYLQEIYAIASSGASQKRTQRAETNLKNDVKPSKSVRSSATKPADATSLDEAIELAFSGHKF